MELSVSNWQENRMEQTICDYFDENGGFHLDSILNVCANRGILSDDPRLKLITQKANDILSKKINLSSMNLKRSEIYLKTLQSDYEFSFDEFKELIKSNITLLDKVVQ